MYIKIENDKPVGDPILEENLRAVLSSISLPQVIDPKHLKDTGFAVFINTDKPEPEKFQKVVEDTPSFDGYTVVQQWKVVDMTSEEKQEYLDNLLFETNSLINSLLASSDWTELPSNQARKSQEWRTAWEEYRTSLRNLRKAPNFPFDIKFPEEPSTQDN